MSTDARELAAELAILHRFNFARRLAGHDYGSGQRALELARRDAALDRLENGIDLTSAALVAAGVELPPSMVRGEPLTDLELAAAFERVGRPRMRRLKREQYRADTQATRRTIRAWRSVERELDGALEDMSATARGL